MKLKEPKNINYCATVVQIKNLIPLENCDNVVSTTILGNSVIVGKNTSIGDIGLFFPVETKLSDVYLSNNNLFRHQEKNINPEEKGYFEDNGRIRCVKFRGHPSEGFFIPIDSLKFIYPSDPNKGYGGIGISDFFKLGDQFDELEGIPICEKYVVVRRTPGAPGNRKKKKPKVSKLIDNQFRFHPDTAQLYNNLHEFHPEDLISISYKIHGTSAVFSKILCLKPLKWYEKLLKYLGVNIVNTQYDNIYSSRKVVKNSDLNPNAEHFYNTDIWGIVNKEIEPYLEDGMTIYGEIAGYLPGGGAIQSMGGKAYDYGCCPTAEEHQLFIYRITYTSPSGKVFEFSMKQVQDWCKLNSLTAVPQFYYGKAIDLCPAVVGLDALNWDSTETTLKHWREKFLATIKERYNEKDCCMSKNKLPEEGCVVRIEDLKLKAYKCKSRRFLLAETADLDKGISDIESEN